MTGKQTCKHNKIQRWAVHAVRGPGLYGDKRRYQGSFSCKSNVLIWSQKKARVPWKKEILAPVSDVFRMRAQRDKAGTKKLFFHEHHDRVQASLSLRCSLNAWVINKSSCGEKKKNGTMGILGNPIGGRGPRVWRDSRGCFWWAGRIGPAFVGSHCFGASVSNSKEEVGRKGTGREAKRKRVG